MIEAHTIDAWTRAADKGRAAYEYLTILGGFAAPLFLWLAGVGVALSASRTAERTGSASVAVERVCRRGLEIFVLAFLFRLQAFIVSPGSHPLMLFRVDVLNIMGPAMIAAGLLWPLSSRGAHRVALYSLAAAVAALVTPIVRASPAVDALPAWLQWYVRPAGELTTFTLFPWSGFVFAGAAVGALLAGVDDPAAERRLQTVLAVVGAATIAAGFYAATRPSIYSVPSSFWTSSPTWFAVRVGVLMVAVAAMASVAARRHGPLVQLGRASLFIYWIHVELVYGYASWLWRHRLPVWGTVGGCIAFSGLMFGLVVARDRYMARRALGFPRPAVVPQA